MNRQEFTKKRDTLWDDIPETTWAYLAGLIDGEGSIALANGGKARYWWAAKLSISNTRLHVLYWIKDVLQVGYVHLSKQINPKARLGGFWAVHGRQADAVLKRCLPYLRIKREHAEIVIAYQGTSFVRKGHGVGKRVPLGVIVERCKLVSRLHDANAKGPPCAS